MKTSPFSRTLASCIVWMLAAGCGFAIVVGEPPEEPPAEKAITEKLPSQLLDNLQAAGAKGKPFVAAYELTGPRGDLRVELGRGGGHLIYLRLVSPDPAKKDLPAFWCGEDGRYFTRSGGETVLMPGLVAMADATTALRASLLGNVAPVEFMIYPNLWLQPENLYFGAGEVAGWCDFLRDSPSGKTGDAKAPTLEITSEILGRLVVDAGNATILEQEINGRTMKRVIYQEEGAVEKVRQELMTFDPGEFKERDMRDAVPMLRKAALMSCRQAVARVEEGSLTVDRMKTNMTAAGDRFMLVMDRAFLDRKANFWDDKMMNGIAANAYKTTVEGLKVKGLSGPALDDACGKIQAADMAAGISTVSQQVVARFGRPETGRIARDLLMGELSSTTPQGRAAAELIEDFLVESSIKNAVLRACERELTRQSRKGLD